MTFAENAAAGSNGPSNIGSSIRTSEREAAGAKVDTRGDGAASGSGDEFEDEDSDKGPPPPAPPATGSLGLPHFAGLLSHVAAAGEREGRGARATAITEAATEAAAIATAAIKAAIKAASTIPIPMCPLAAAGSTLASTGSAPLPNPAGSKVAARAKRRRKRTTSNDDAYDWSPDAGASGAALKFGSLNRHLPRAEWLLWPTPQASGTLQVTVMANTAGQWYVLSGYYGRHRTSQWHTLSDCYGQDRRPAARVSDCYGQEAPQASGTL